MNTDTKKYPRPPRGEKAYMWNHLDDKNLYNDNDYALTKINEGDFLNNKIIFHTYWYGELNRKHVFSLKSLICTQDLNKVEIYVWLDIENGYDNYLNNEFLAPLLPFLTIKGYDIFKEAIDMISAEHISILNQIEGVIHRGDAFRFIILAKYGGVYFDPDVMFLKNFDPLFYSEFCYAWEYQSYANSAVLLLRKNSYLSKYLLQKGIEKACFYPWITLNYTDVNLTPLLVYPCTLFDPLWMHVADRKTNIVSSSNKPFNDFEGFFTEFNNIFKKMSHINSYQDFFKGAFAYHWHGQWTAKEYENSYFGLFDNQFNEILNK